MLEEIYNRPVVKRSTRKKIDHINELYQHFIEASHFSILATYGEKGIDCSPRGVAGEFVINS